MRFALKLVTAVLIASAAGTVFIQLTGNRPVGWAISFVLGLIGGATAAATEL